MSGLRVYLSGGPNRSQRWSDDIKTKAEASKALRALKKGIVIVKSGSSDYIVIPDTVEWASDSAMKTGGRVENFSQFIAMMKRRTSKKKASRKKTVSTKKTSTRKR